MTITIISSTAPPGLSATAPFSLAEGGAAGPANLKLREQRASQIVEFFRSPAIRVFDRLNRRVRLTFDVTRTFSTIDLAQTFLLQHSQLMPANGLVTVTAEGDGGGYPLFFLPSAEVDSIEGSHIGATTRHSYQIIAPNIQTTQPTLNS